jgi:hypothetical protein
VRVHHARREQHWRVLKIIEPENAAPSRVGVSRYILLVDGPFAFYKGHDGEQCITATRRRGRWWITPNTSANPRRGIPPATDAHHGCHAVSQGRRPRRDWRPVPSLTPYRARVSIPLNGG